MCRGQLEASGFLVEVAEMVLHRRISPDALRDFDQGVFRRLVFAQLEVGPAQRIEISAISGIEIDRLLDEAESFVELDPAVRQRGAQLVQFGGIVGLGI